MTRLKFLVFALPTLGLLGYLVSISPGVAARSADQASVGLAGAPSAVALHLEAQRSDLQAAVIRLAASPAALNPGPKTPTGKAEAPTADRFSAVRTALLDGLPEAHKASLAIAVVNEAGVLFAQGSADPAAAPEGLDVPALAAAALVSGAGSVGALNGAPTLFYATPLLISDRNEVKAAGSVLVGLPLLPDAKALAEVVARDLKLEAVGIVSNGALIGAAGPQKALADKALKALKPNGTATAIEQGPTEVIGPLKFPLLTPAPLALETGLRREIGGYPYEVVAVVSARGSVEALATFQVYSVSIFAALALLSLAVLLLLGGGDDDGVRMSVPPPMPVPPVSRPTAEPIAAMAAPLAAEASPDDFDFPSSAATGSAPLLNTAPPPAPPAPQQNNDETSDPFAKVAPTASAPAPATFNPQQQQANIQTAQQPAYVPSGGGSQPFFTPPPPVPSAQRTLNPFDDSEEADRTVAYSAASRPGSGVIDPFAMASAQSQDDTSDPNADSTRVAAVPKELIQAARGGGTGTTGDHPVARVPAGAMPKVQQISGTEEERHFQEVFRDFIATRERCGEPADGLTFDKFKQKLLKNKDALVAKYNCRTVRFQVYVKDGKAALKATPVKD